MKKQIIVVGVLGLGLATAWNVGAKDEPAAAPAAPAAASEAKPSAPTGPAVRVPIKDVPNAFKLGRKIISGACPHGEAGFKALSEAGVKTIISVDGAKPDEAVAKKYGMRYVHIPVTYSGITRKQALDISRAVRDLEGPVFIHCHHGKHRSPAAAVLAAMALEGWTNADAVAAMKQAGTSPKYTGLYGDARDFKVPTKEELDAADGTFPAAVAIAATAASMVEIDERWEHIGQAKDAGWAAPADHPDIDPPHEALLLRENFRELNRHPQTLAKSEDYRKKMLDAENAMAALETALRAKENNKAQAAYDKGAQSCSSCHAVYRDPATAAATTATGNN